MDSHLNPKFCEAWVQSVEISKSLRCWSMGWGSQGILEDKSGNGEKGFHVSGLTPPPSVTSGQGEQVLLCSAQGGATPP